MGFISAAAKFLKTPVGKAIETGLNTLSVTLAHPIEVAKAAINPNVKVSTLANEFAQKSPTQASKEIILGTVGIATTILGGAALGTAAKAGTLATAAKTLIPATAKGKVIAAVAAPVVIGAVVQEPAAAAKAIANTPSALANVGGNIAKVAANPTLENVKELVTENPVILAGAAIIGTGVAAKTILPAIAVSRQTAAIEEQTKAIQDTTYSTQPVQLVQVPAVSKAIEADTRTPTQPVTPATHTPTATTKAKKKRKAQKSQIPSISQRVNVIVSNKSNSVGMKNYLKREVLAL